MRTVLASIALLVALPVAAQAQSCRGAQAFDMGGGTKGCIVAIDMGSITTTRTRDDGASSQKWSNSQPFVAAVMTGPVPKKNSTVKKQMIALCKVSKPKVYEKFSTSNFNRIILYMDWREAGGELKSGFSTDTCKGFRFFDS